MTIKNRFRPWGKKNLPKKILVMRFQALGDTVITLPYLQHIKRQHPEILIDFLTREEVMSIPQASGIFNKVIAIGGGRNAKVQFVLAMLKIPYLWLQRYDAILDLQNHRISIIVRKLLATRSWAEFDRTSPIPAGERTRQTIESLRVWRDVKADTNFDLKTNVDDLLIRQGWKKGYKLVVLNPAGAFVSRSWPVENYVVFAKLWLEKIDSETQFVLLLLSSMEERANKIKMALGPACVNLTGRANQVEAFTVLKKCTFVLSEDSGLMHMAWVQGIPTLALFSSSRKDWSAPLGEKSLCLDSSDLECGPCALEVCKYGDNRCLVRYSPEELLTKAKELVA